MANERASDLEMWYLTEHYARIAHDAVQRQRHRIVKRCRRREAPSTDDAYLFVLALADLVRAARAAQLLLEQLGLRVAMEAFDQAVPGVRDFRNVLEHWEKYARGEGRKTELGTNPWFTWTSTEPPRLRVCTLELDVEEAYRESVALFGALCVASRRVPAETREDHATEDTPPGRGPKGESGAR